MLQTIESSFSEPVFVGGCGKQKCHNNYFIASYSDTLFRLNNDAPQRRSMLRPEQKPFEMIEAILWKFTEPDQILFESFSVQKPQPNHVSLKTGTKNFAGCGMDSDCVYQMIRSPVNVLLAQASSAEADIEKYDRDCRGAEKYLARWKTERCVEIFFRFAISFNVFSWSQSVFFKLFWRCRGNWKKGVYPEFSGLSYGTSVEIVCMWHGYLCLRHAYGMWQ